MRLGFGAILLIVLGMASGLVQQDADRSGSAALIAGALAQDPAHDTGFLGELIALRDNGEHGQAMQRLARPASAQQARTALDFARDSLMDGSSPSAYSLPYISLLWRVNQGQLKEAAVLWYFVLRLRTVADVQRCADPTAVSARLASILPQMQPIHDFALELPAERRLKLLETALSIDLKMPVRRNDRWLCTGGASYFERYFAKHGGDSVQAVENPEQVGQAFALPFDPELVDLIDEDAWADRRTEVRESFVKEIAPAN